jgi:hypothetical protein
MKVLKIALAFLVVPYVVCVGFLVLSRTMGFNERLSTPEVFYGPAITLASGVIIFARVYALLGLKKREKP